MKSATALIALAVSVIILACGGACATPETTADQSLGVARQPQSRINLRGWSSSCRAHVGPAGNK